MHTMKHWHHSGTNRQTTCAIPAATFASRGWSSAVAAAQVSPDERQVCCGQRTFRPTRWRMSALLPGERDLPADWSRSAEPFRQRAPSRCCRSAASSGDRSAVNEDFSLALTRRGHDENGAWPHPLAVHLPFRAAIVERCSVSWRRRAAILYARDQVSRLVLRNEQLNQACLPPRIAMTHT